MSPTTRRAGPALAGQGTSPGPPPAPRTVTFRAVALALALMPLNALWIVHMETVRNITHPTTLSLLFNAVFILVALTGLNGRVARIWPARAFSQGELLLVYSMLCVASCLAGVDLGRFLVPTLAWPYSQATTANGYAALFWRYLPRWALVPDVEATRGFWLGHDTLYTWPHLRAWLPAGLIWTGFVVVLLFVMQCVNVLLRRQWSDYERLTYPLTRIPLAITQNQPGGRGGTPLTRSRLFWAGFALAAGIDLVNALNYYYPAIPPILTPGNGQSFTDLQQYVVNKPWSAIGWTPLSFYPCIVGLGMLMPMDFLFSSWFFYLVWKMQAVAAVAAAWDADSRMPYANYQAFGAYFLFCVSSVWLGRRYLGQVFRCALGRPSELDDSDEPLPYRWALLGIAAGLTLLVGFSAVLGLSPWLGVLFFLIYFGLAVAITRMRAELGTPVHDLHFTGPDWALADLIGTRALGPQNLAVFSVFFWFNRAYRAHPMPHQLEGFRLAEQSGAMRSGARHEMRRWFWALLLAGAAGTVCAFWAMLHCYYIYGGTARISGTFGPEAWDRYAGWLRQPQGPNGRVAAAIGVGFCFAAFLQAMRVRFSWWPFHPLAYAVSGSWEMNLLWMPLLIAWGVKALLLRYGGGVRTYQASLPFFYGLILGQFIPGSLLHIWSTLTGIPAYQFWQ